LPLVQPDGIRPGATREVNQPVPEDPERRATWAKGRRRYRKTERRGNSKLSQSAPPKDARIGATRCFITGEAGRCGTRGNPRPVSGSAARRREETGQPADSLKPAARNDVRFGATRKSITGTVNGLKARGNSQLRRRRGQRMQRTGQPGDAQQAKQEDAGEEATRNLIKKLNGTMLDPRICKGIRRTPETARFLAFSILE